MLATQLVDDEAGVRLEEGIVFYLFRVGVPAHPLLLSGQHPQHFQQVQSRRSAGGVFVRQRTHSSSHSSSPASAATGGSGETLNRITPPRGRSRGGEVVLGIIHDGARSRAPTDLSASAADVTSRRRRPLASRRHPLPLEALAILPRVSLGVVIVHRPARRGVLVRGRARRPDALGDLRGGEVHLGLQPREVPLALRRREPDLAPPFATSTIVVIDVVVVVVAGIVVVVRRRGGRDEAGHVLVRMLGIIPEVPAVAIDRVPPSSILFAVGVVLLTGAKPLE